MTGEVLARFAASGGIGFILGLVAVSWVEPTTAGGIVLLVAIVVIASVVVWELVSLLLRAARSSPQVGATRGHKDPTGPEGGQTAGVGGLRPTAAPPSPAARTGAPPRVFISYSHADGKWLERLKRHLKPLVREGYLDCWDDTHLRPGDDWQQEIRNALDAAQVAVLLISADFFASDFIDERELPPLLAAAQDQGVRILPLILSASRFARDPSLARFQAVNPPDRPLNEMLEGEQEKVLERLAQTIESTISRPRP